MQNLKTTLAGSLAAAGLAESAGTILLSDDVKKAAYGLILAALGAFLKGLFAQDAPPKP